MLSFKQDIKMATKNGSSSPFFSLKRLYMLRFSRERKMEILNGIYRIAMTEEIEREVTKVCSLGGAIKEAGREEGREEGRIEMLIQLVNDGDFTVEKAAAKVNMTSEDFLKKKEELEK